ncbi:MAG: type IV secretion system DNA-binding domain-containing protein [Candidatus Nomurabacteria bacterium]|nr:type IV secretion system DNA-binding domain-containing protein [Candidatus Nomurabacteria bacterium]
MEGFNLNNAPKFKTPQEELDFLRAHIAEREKTLNTEGQEVGKEQLAHDVISEYRKHEPEDIMHKSALLKNEEVESLILRLKPESHDSKMEEMLGILLEKGIINTLSVISRMNNPHLDDDFHRFVVQYLYSTHKVPGLKENTPLFKSLDMKLFEITLPDMNDSESSKKGLKELLGAMEQFYAGMHSVGEGRENFNRNHFTLEIALSEGSDHFVFYTAVPNHKADLFEKQLFGVHPNAKIVEVPDDYNIFSENGFISASFASLAHHKVYPIKTYDTLDHDPLNIILNIFSKLKKMGEGASIQFTICPEDDEIIKEFHTILLDVKDGMSVRTASSVTRQVAKEFKSLASELIFGVSKKKEDKKVNEKAVTNITEKMKSTIMATNIRIIASAENATRSKQILSDIESSFNQFTEADRNGFDFNHPQGLNLSKLIHDFSYRMFSNEYSMPLNLKELATIFHFPYGIISSQLKQAKSGIAPAPMEMGNQGIVLGVNSYRGIDTEIRMAQEDRVRHMYVIGQTGTGKTNILLNMITQDIQNGDGVCYIDPHGTDIQTILARIPKDRIDDVIYFDPAYTARPMGLNMLEYDVRYPEQKTFVVNELMSIFNKLFDMKTSGGPMFEQYFKNSAFLVMEHPESGSTLLEIGRVLSDKAFRDMKLSYCKNPIISQFWKSAEQTTGDQSIANFVPYITSKFDNFISNDIMRPVVLQEKSVFNFREIMDNKKILLVNLSKGRLGEMNANLIGLLIVGKIQMAALSRVDMYGQKMNDFYLYIDEFQNVTTDSISSILSEARKYRLSLTIAHQYISQLEEGIKNAVFGNVGSMAVFRVSAEDAQFLESKFKPTFMASDIMKLDNYNAYLSMLVNGQPTKPFNIKTIAPVEGNSMVVDQIKQLSYLKYGRDRAEVEDEIMAKYKL